MLKSHERKVIIKKIQSNISAYFYENSITLRAIDEQTFKAIANYTNLKTGLSIVSMQKLSCDLGLSYEAIKYRIKVMLERAPEVNGESLIIKHKLKNRKGKFSYNIYEIPFLTTYNPYRNKKLANEFKTLGDNFLELGKFDNNKEYKDFLRDEREKYIQENKIQIIEKNLNNFTEFFKTISDKFELPGVEVADIFYTMSNQLSDGIGIVNIKKYIFQAFKNKIEGNKIKSFVAKFNVLMLEITKQIYGCDVGIVPKTIIRDIFMKYNRNFGLIFS